MKMFGDVGELPGNRIRDFRGDRHRVAGDLTMPGGANPDDGKCLLMLHGSLLGGFGSLLENRKPDFDDLREHICEAALVGLRKHSDLIRVPGVESQTHLFVAAVLLCFVFGVFIVFNV